MNPRYHSTGGVQLALAIYDNLILPMWSDSIIGQTVPKNIDGNQGIRFGSNYYPNKTDVSPSFSTYDWSSNLGSVNVSITDYNSGIVNWGTVYIQGTYTFQDADLISGHRYYYMTSGQMKDSSTSGSSSFSLFSVAT